MRELAARLRKLVAAILVGKPGRIGPRVEARRKYGVVVVSRLSHLNYKEAGTFLFDAEDVYDDVMGLH